MNALYENVLAQLLAESKTDTYARTIVQKIIKAVKVKMDKINKQGFLELKMTIPWPSFMPRKDMFKGERERLYRQQQTGLNAHANSIYVMLAVIIEKRNKKDVADVSGSWSPAEDALRIEVFVESKNGIIMPLHFSMIQERCYEVVRHELQHAGQDSATLMSGFDANDKLQGALPGQVWTSAEALKGYLLSRAELEAFCAGIYHQARRTRKPFIQVLDQRIHSFMEMAAKKRVDIVEVRNALLEVRYKWIEYAKQKYPKAQF